MSGKRFTPSKLIAAIQGGNLNTVLQALEDGADIEEADMHGQAGLPLRTACFNGDIAIVRELIGHGANINAAGADGPCMPLRLALRREHHGVVALLLKLGAQIPEGVNVDQHLLYQADELDALTPQPSPVTPTSLPDSAPPDFNVAESIDLTAPYGTDTHTLDFDLQQTDITPLAPQTPAGDRPTGTSFWKTGRGIS